MNYTICLLRAKEQQVDACPYSYALLLTTPAMEREYYDKTWKLQAQSASQSTCRYTRAVHDRAEMVYVHHKESLARPLLGSMQNPQALVGSRVCEMEPGGLEPTTSCMPCM